MMAKGKGRCSKAWHERKGSSEGNRHHYAPIPADFVGPVRASVPNSLTYVLAIQNVLTHYVKLVMTPDNLADTAVRILTDE